MLGVVVADFNVITGSMPPLASLAAVTTDTRLNVMTLQFSVCAHAMSESPLLLVATLGAVDPGKEKILLPLLSIV